MKQSITGVSRRHLRWSASAAGLIVPATRALAADVPAIEGPPRKMTLASMPMALCHIAVPVADKRGFFTKHNFDVDFVDGPGQPTCCWKRSPPARRTLASA